jgi:hypothetical protein
MENWLDKHRPTKISEMIGDMDKINLIGKFICQFIDEDVDKNDINPNIIIIGENGVGKKLWLVCLQ